MPRAKTGIALNLDDGEKNNRVEVSILGWGGCGWGGCTLNAFFRFEQDVDIFTILFLWLCVIVGIEIDAELDSDGKPFHMTFSLSLSSSFI